MVGFRVEEEDDALDQLKKKVIGMVFLLFL